MVSTVQLPTASDGLEHAFRDAGQAPRSIGPGRCRCVIGAEHDFRPTRPARPARGCPCPACCGVLAGRLVAKNSRISLLLSTTCQATVARSS